MLIVKQNRKYILLIWLRLNLNAFYILEKLKNIIDLIFFSSSKTKNDLKSFVTTKIHCGVVHWA